MGEGRLNAQEDSIEESELSIVIREAEMIDIPLVHRLMRLAFEEYRGRLHPQSGALREEIADIEAKVRRGGGAILVWRGTEAIGSAQYSCKENYMYIGRVSVVPEARGYGLGSRILAFLEQLALDKGMPETGLEVRLSVPRNIAFYRAKGYEVVEHLEYPERTDSWYVMRKRLKGELT